MGFEATAAERGSQENEDATETQRNSKQDWRYGTPLRDTQHDHTA